MLVLKPSAEPPDASGAAAAVPPASRSTLARAGRYALLRRIAPALRHDMVVHLQALGMMAEALLARLERGGVPADDLQAAVAKLHRLSRQAVDGSVQANTWLQATEDDTVPLRLGVDECASLLASSLNFRGYVLRNEAGDTDLPVSRRALRFLLCAALLCVADAAGAPGDVVVRTGAVDGQALVTVEYEAHPEREVMSLADATQEPLAWPEIVAMAAEEQAAVAKHGAAIEVRLPRALVTGPVKMAPV